MTILRFDRSLGCVWVRVRSDCGHVVYYALGYLFGRPFVLQWLPRRWWVSSASWVRPPSFVAAGPDRETL